jgi:hypothetical protein
METKRVKRSELQLADVIDPFPDYGFDAWQAAIVKQITETEIRLFRPYGATADFSYTGGVICYVGIEEYALPRDDSAVLLIRRRELR